MAINNILLVRTDRIGDVILTTPAITILRRNYPDARIYFLTRPYTAPLLKYHKDLDEIIEYNPDDQHHGLAGHGKLAKLLQSKQLDMAFLFHPKPGLAFALFRAGIPRRVGTGYRWYSPLLNHRIYEHRKYGKRHELEYNLSLIKPFITEVPPREEISFNFIEDSGLESIRSTKLQEMSISNDYLIIHPGSGGSAPNLPAEKYARIIQYLSENQSHQIVLVGDQSEKNLIGQISDASGKQVICITGQWNLETYMAVIAGARFFISNSTGPLHIARAFNIPLLAFYCPAIPCSPDRWGPYNRRDSVLIPNIVPCKSCNTEKCPHGNCLDQIYWENIREKIDRLIEEDLAGH